MDYTIVEADSYIGLNVIDTESWVESDDNRKQRILNVAHRTLTRKFPEYHIPDEATYEFSAHLATVFSDTYKMKLNGVTGFTGAGFTYQFTDTGDKGLDKMIPPAVTELIQEVNGVVIGVTKSSIKRTVL